MKKHKYIIWFMAAWHIFITLVSIMLYYARLETRTHAPLIPADVLEEYLSSGKALFYRVEWNVITAYIIIIGIISIISSILLIVKKTWGRRFSVILGIILIPFGIYIFINQPYFVDQGSFTEKIIDYFRYMGSHLGYIELISIIYGIYLIIYFTRKNVIQYIKQ